MTDLIQCFYGHHTGQPVLAGIRN